MHILSNEIGSRWSAFFGALAILLLAGPVSAQKNPINIARFGAVSVMSKNAEEKKTAAPPLFRSEARVSHWRLPVGKVLQVAWTNPRDVHAVELSLASDFPGMEKITLEWWRRIWPDNGSGGWMKLDDPFNGEWTAARCIASRSPGHLRLTFAPLSTNEAAGIQHTGQDYRQTYKIRLSCSSAITVRELAVHSDAVAQSARLRFEWDLTAVPETDNRVGARLGTPSAVAHGQAQAAGLEGSPPSQPQFSSLRWDTASKRPKFEARNGRILETSFSGKNVATVELEYADTPRRLSADRGLVVCRGAEQRSFSVFIDDVVREGGLYIRDLDVFVSDADKHLTFTTWKNPSRKQGTIAEQVARMPEQSFPEVMKAIPLKPANYMFLGVPELRQEIALGPQGDIRLLADSLRSPGPDADRRPWKWKDLTYSFSTSEELPAAAKDQRKVTRTLEEGWLPVARHEWKTEDFSFAQSCVAAPLLGDIAQLRSKTGTEPVVLLTRFEIKNTATNARTASLWLELNHALPWKAEADGTLLLLAASESRAPAGLTPVRGRFNLRGRGQLEMAPYVSGSGAANSAPSQAIRYQVQLGPRESHAVELAVPYIELLDARELAALKSISYSAVHDSVVNFWKARIAQGMTYQVPDQFLNEFFKANLWHVLISTDLDPITGEHQHGAATHHYKNYLNETAMVAQSLEMRGEPEEAYKLIQPFLASQSALRLPGNFKSKDGVFYAAHPASADPYTAQGYNMHHGWGMWIAAEHFFWSKDTNYLAHIADQLVKACDWVTRERQATRVKNLRGFRPVEYGLAPAGDLEDVEEYHYFYATDAYYYLGMKHAANALARLNHPQARRIARDTDKFLEDIQASVAESVATSPVVRLKDGSYVPFVPPRAYALTHQKEGWIREGLYPALHLRDGEVYPETHPFVDWMIQDLEDNIFLSKESGYGVENQQTNFFNLGGFTLQPNLLDLPIAYLKRDQIPNFLRGFYNTCWASLYPDTMCFAEWVPSYGKGGGPLYKTPDECKFIQWMRAMLILERDDALELGLGVPRAWMADGKRIKIERAATLFGSVDLEINSHVSRNEVQAFMTLRKTEAPKSIRLRLRHPDGKQIISVTVNGKPARINVARQLIELPPDEESWQIAAQF